MKAEKKTASEQVVVSKKPADNKVNPFFKLIADKKRIAKAIREKVSLASLKDIKFVRPL